MFKIDDANAKHLYELEVTSCEVEGKYKIEVEANTRSRATERAENHGFDVHSVNMIG